MLIKNSSRHNDIIEFSKEKKGLELILTVNIEDTGIGWFFCYEENKIWKRR